MDPIERFPNCTSSNNDIPEADLNILRIDHAMRERFDDPGIDLIRYTAYDDRMDIVPLHPFAVVPESLEIQFWDEYLVRDGDLPDIIEIVAQHIPRLLERIRWSRKRDRLLGRKTDTNGNVITDAALWKYDPLYPELSRIFGFDCSDPVLLTPSVYDFNTEIEQAIETRYLDGIRLQGELVDGDCIATSFHLNEGNLGNIILSKKRTFLLLRIPPPPHTSRAQMIGKPLSTILGGDSLPVDLLNRRIVDTDTLNSHFEVCLEAPDFTEMPA